MEEDRYKEEYRHQYRHVASDIVSGTYSDRDEIPEQPPVTESWYRDKSRHVRITSDIMDSTYSPPAVPSRSRKEINRTQSPVPGKVSQQPPVTDFRNWGGNRVEPFFNTPSQDNTPQNAVPQSRTAAAAQSWNGEEPRIDAHKYPDLYHVVNTPSDRTMMLEGQATIVEGRRRIKAAQQAHLSQADKGTKSPTMKYLAAVGNAYKKEERKVLPNIDRMLAERLARIGYSRKQMETVLAKGSPYLMELPPGQRQPYLKKTIDRVLQRERNREKERQRRQQQPSHTKHWQQNPDYPRTGQRHQSPAPSRHTSTPSPRAISQETAPKQWQPTPANDNRPYHERMQAQYNRGVDYHKSHSDFYGAYQIQQELQAKRPLMDLSKAGKSPDWEQRLNQAEKALDSPDKATYDGTTQREYMKELARRTSVFGRDIVDREKDPERALNTDMDIASRLHMAGHDPLHIKQAILKASPNFANLSPQQQSVYYDKQIGRVFNHEKQQEAAAEWGRINNEKGIPANERRLDKLGLASNYDIDTHQYSVESTRQEQVPQPYKDGMDKDGDIGVRMYAAGSRREDIERAFQKASPTYAKLPDHEKSGYYDKVMQPYLADQNIDRTIRDVREQNQQRGLGEERNLRKLNLATELPSPPKDKEREYER